MLKITVGTLAMACVAAQQPTTGPQGNEPLGSGPLGHGPLSAVSLQTADGKVAVVATPLDQPSTSRTLWQGTRPARLLARLHTPDLLLQIARQSGSNDPGTLHTLDPRTFETREVTRCWWDQKVDLHNGRLVKFASKPHMGYPLVSVGLQPGARPEQIGAIEFVKRTQAHGNQILAVEAEYRAVWKIDLRRNSCEKLFTPTRGAVGITLDRSPSGQRIVLGVARYDGGEIVVLDASTGKVVRHWTKLQIRSDLFVPELPTGFVDDDTVASIETGKHRKMGVDHFRVTRSITTGKQLTRTATAWAHQSGSDPERLRREQLLGEAPVWSSDRPAVLRQLRTEPCWFRLSPDEKYAIVQRDPDGEVELLGAGAARTLGSGTVLDCRWLPAVGSCATDHRSGTPHTRYSDLPVKK